MRKLILAFMFMLIPLAFAEDAVILRDFKIDGAKVQKKVHIINKREYNYDGNLIRNFSPDDSDFMYFYNEDGRIEKIYYTYSHISKNGICWYEYDLAKNQTELKFADYREVRYYYDDATKLCTKKTDTGYCDEEYEYDEKGNMIKSTNQMGTTVYEYDEAGNLRWSRDERSNTEYFYAYDSKNRLVYYLWLPFNDGSGEYLERIYKFDDEKLTEKMHTNLSEEGIFSSYTSSYVKESDERGLLVHSLYEQDYIDSDDFLDIASQNPPRKKKITEWFFKYNFDENLMYATEIKGEKKTNYFYEYTLWDNGNVNTEMVYEEFE